MNKLADKPYHRRYSFRSSDLACEQELQRCHQWQGRRLLHLPLCANHQQTKRPLSFFSWTFPLRFSLTHHHRRRRYRYLYHQSEPPPRRISFLFFRSHRLCRSISPSHKCSRNPSPSRNRSPSRIWTCRRRLGQQFDASGPFEEVCRISVLQ